MSQAQVDVVRRMYDAFHGGDAAGALSFLHPDVVIDATMRVDSEMGTGREAVASTIGGWVGSFDEWDEEIEELRDLGTHVLVVAVQRGRGRGSGIEIEQRYALLYEVSGEQITRLTMYPDPADALDAAGAAG